MGVFVITFVLLSVMSCVLSIPVDPEADGVVFGPNQGTVQLTATNSKILASAGKRRVEVGHLMDKVRSQEKKLKDLITQKI